MTDTYDAGHAWQVAHDRLVATVKAHPRYPDLIREVAVAEQPSMPGTSWLRRNSRTYAAWVTRGMPILHKRRRALLLAKQITREVDLDPLPNDRERYGFVYATAMADMRARSKGTT